ncbi:hypothetical protein [Natronorubrum sp. FCH18a]|uniref:hypothetical protein n=1 Tax=Natronorubrum sp. FCH18a TaxID=3447018 RepID=UPI003F5152A0
MPIANCTVCEWERRTDDDSSADINRAMIDHYVETGHGPIERLDLEDALSTLSARHSSQRRLERE